jgi:uncharacterized protein
MAREKKVKLPRGGAVAVKACTGIDVDEPGTRHVSNSILTYTGKRFWPLAPLAEEVDIRDIAHSLSQQCRFTGHTRSFYSVAQHSVLVADECRDGDKLWGLLHDATEAYVSDIASPVKRQLPFYKELELKLHLAIAQRFGLELYIPTAVKYADRILLATERRDLMPPSDDAGFPTEPPLAARIAPWSSETAERRFLEKYAQIVTGLVGIRYG